MSKRVLFNGAVLVRPGAATKIDASQFEDATLAGIGIVGIIGAADAGQPRAVQVFSTPAGVQRFYGSGDLVEAANILATPTNDNRISQGAQTIVCYKTNNSTQASLVSGVFTFTSQQYGLNANNVQLALSNPLAGNDRTVTITGLNQVNGALITETSPSLGLAGKFSIQYIGGGTTCTMSITASQLTITTSGVPSSGSVTSGNAAPFNVLPGQTLVVSINGGGNQTITFAGTKGNKQGAAGTFTSLNGTTLGVAINGGTAQTITFTAAAVDANTTALDINNQLINGSAVVVGGQVKIQSDTFGTGSTVNITVANAAAGFSSTGLGTAGTGDAVNLAAMTAAEAVAKIVLTGATVVAVGNNVKISSNTTGIASTVQVQGSSTASGFNYDNAVHAGSVTGGVSAGDSYTLPFQQYSTLNQIVRLIAANPNFVVSSLITNDTTFNPANLDAITTQDIKTSLYTAFARNFDLADWINKNSQLVTAVFTQGSVGPIATFVATPLAGGTRGTAANTDWANAFTALLGVNVNQLVPLASADGSTLPFGDTYTIASILAGLNTHCTSASSTAGRHEREGWIGLNMTKANLISNANTINSPHVVMLGEQVQRPRTLDGSVVFFPEWSAACLGAGMRAGAPLGEPVTAKYVNCSAVQNDVSWSNTFDGDLIDLTLNGVTCIVPIQGKGIRFDKVITTYTRTDNDAFYEETIVQNWKNISFGLRSFLEDRYTGRPGSLDIVSTVPAAVTSYMEKQLVAGTITNSVVNGVVKKGYRNITYSLNGDVLSIGVTFSPTPGINYILNTLVLVPAQISGGGGAS